MNGEAEFDRPLFKKLASNDTGSAPGHMGGFLVPKELESYFPQMFGKVSPANPAVYEDIRAELFVGAVSKGTVATRYQYQTWGGTRSPERRITGSLGELLGKARGGDYLLIERSLTDPRLYRLRLLAETTDEGKKLAKLVGSRSWGPVSLSDPPVTEIAIEKALAEQVAHERSPLELFDNDAAFTETRTWRISRSRAFQQRVSEEYGPRCALCGGGFHDPAKRHHEIEAAHIVPRTQKGADDVRNGLALCRSHHWAFDRGLWGMNGGTVFIPPKISALPENKDLGPFNGRTLRPPSSLSSKPDAGALSWHLKEIVSRHL